MSVECSEDGWYVHMLHMDVYHDMLYTNRFHLYSVYVQSGESREICTSSMPVLVTHNPAAMLALPLYIYTCM